MTLDYLEIIVPKANDRAEKRSRQRQPNIHISQVRPEQGRYGEGHNHDDAAHAWRALFYLMMRGAILANRIADMLLPKDLYDLRPDQKTDYEARHGCRRHPERDVSQEVKDNRAVF